MQLSAVLLPDAVVLFLSQSLAIVQLLLVAVFQPFPFLSVSLLLSFSLFPIFPSPWLRQLSVSLLLSFSLHLLPLWGFSWFLAVALVEVKQKRNAAQMEDLGPPFHRRAQIRFGAFFYNEEYGC